MSSSEPEGCRRNATCHTTARTSPMTTTRRENFGVAKNSRIAKRYATPVSVKEPMKYGPPRSPKLREQTVSATHNEAPSKYTLHAGVIFTIILCGAGIPARLALATASKAGRNARSTQSLLFQHQPLQGSDSTRVRNACTVLSFLKIFPKTL